ARRVNVSTSTRAGSTPPTSTRWATRRVRTRVLPDPAPATTARRRAGSTTAARCSSSRPRSTCRAAATPRPRGPAAPGPATSPPGSGTSSDHTAGTVPVGCDGEGDLRPAGPSTVPPVVECSPEEFEQLVADALDAIPEDLGRRMDN